MPRNIEIKARIDSVDTLASALAAFAGQGPIRIDQDDTFFACANGRLKLREFAPDAGELIFYRRDDLAGPRESFYLIAPTSAPDTMREALTLAHGQVGRVRKRRTLFMVGRTRVHLDRVESLGEFLELEVMLEEGEPAEQGVAQAHALMAQLGIVSANLVRGAYVDLLAASR